MEKPDQQKGFPRLYLVVLISLALLISLYTISRNGGRWGEVDTVVFTNVIRSNLESGKLVPDRNVYGNGYGYQALAVIVLETTGISLRSFQTILSIILSVWIVVPAWLAYRELTHSELAASLATLILLVQPEFLFPLLRGTHEKFTRGLMLICLYLMLRSLRTKPLRQLAALAICFYLSAYAMITFNSFLATSFILALIIALVLLWLGNRWLAKGQDSAHPVTTKLLYVTFSLLVIAFLFTFYAYPPATNQIRVLQSVWDQLALLFLQVEETATNPYQVISYGWISQPVYFLVSLANWLLLGITVPLWLRQTHSWFNKRKEQPARHELALWALYAAFASLGAISVLVDISGAIAGNLQHRMFPSFAMIGAPVAGLWLTSRMGRTQRNTRWIHITSSAAIGILMILSVFKATNEPLLSNNWLFFTPGEQTSISWAEDNLSGRTLWSGLSGRVTIGYNIHGESQSGRIQLDPYIADPRTHDFLISESIRLFALRTKQPLPIQADSLITYDNGEAQIYHRRPLTPFQK